MTNDLPYVEVQRMAEKRFPVCPVSRSVRNSFWLTMGEGLCLGSTSITSAARDGRKPTATERLEPNKLFREMCTSAGGLQIFLLIFRDRGTGFRKAGERLEL
jgi:hypothetical protein